MRVEHLATAVALGLLLARPLAADSVRLRDGRLVTGTLEGAGVQALHLRVGGRLEHLPIAEVESIRFSPRPRVPRAEAPAPRPLTRAKIEGHGLAQVIRRADQAE